MGLQAGYFMQASTSAKICTTCPVGAVCAAGSNVTVQNLQLEKGYWRTNVNSGNVLACPVLEACLGGSNSTCREGHEGPYCDVCVKKYALSWLCRCFIEVTIALTGCAGCAASSYYENYDGLCNPCSSEAVLNSFALIIVLVVLAVLLVYFSVKYTLYAARQSNNRYILSLLDEVEHRVLKLAQGAVARAQSFALSPKSSKSKAKSEQASTRSDLSSQRTSIIRAQKIVVKLKILFGTIARASLHVLHRWQLLIL